MSRTVRNFEDLLAWQRAIDLAVKVEALTRDEPLKSEYALRNQVRRSAQSIHANIAEGFERATRSEFHRFLGIAKGSCGELRSHLLFIERASLVASSVVSPLIDEAIGVGRIIGKLRTAVSIQRRSPLVPRASCLVPGE